MLLPRQRRSAATDTSTSSSGVTSVVISTATARPLVATIANTDEAAGEKTTKRISRQVLHRRLRRLGRKLDDVMTMFKDVADAARIEGKGGRSGQKRGARAGQNARRRLRGKGGRFVAAPREEEVKDSHPDPDFTTTTTTKDQERQQVAVVGERKKKQKKQRRRERGELPVGSQEAKKRQRKEDQKLVQLRQCQEQAEVTQRELRMRAEAAEEQAAQMKTQLAQAQAELQEHAEYADAEVAAAREEATLQVQQAADRHRGELEKRDVRMSEVEAQAAEMKARLICSGQEAARQHQEQVKWRDARIMELTEEVEAAAKKEAAPRQNKRQGRLVSMWDPTRTFLFWQNDVTGQRFADTGGNGLRAWQQETNRTGTPLWRHAVTAEVTFEDPTG